MTKHDANIIIHENIMGECWHTVKCTEEFTDEFLPILVCEKCGETFDIYNINPIYCEDANEAARVLYQLPISDFYSQDSFWNCEYRDFECSIQLASLQDFCLAICTAALRTLGIMEDIKS